ncbi:uncharacterized protein CC84DRAFT_1256054 [Paraphaeosphaeria sporulosa]|uniref:Uncharacterized protein n=1 Tax=Paraphaeosphaeria sporulosa TaxID=1460663 RepID=A0A177CRL3_9PLEO|nr:uncharacterized protein CC84DRAFT_1256054 [Paraphaeosphaeria sporulosa]OAG10165.1 hypothetical protein CC84DRAFT_1256054 [Paraphaeosphaeria sporulosa]
MDDRRASANSNAPSMNNIRNALIPRTPKEKISPNLKKALDVLNLKDLDALEHHFLGMIPFLKPWSQYRDSFLLIQPGSAPRSSETNKVRGMDILWFYTNFSDGELRYDPRADDASSLFTTDETQYGNFDTTHWSVEEHEKMLYAWLLQEFRVGKARNPFGFAYFELQNVCTAWRTVFVPIVKAVRDSYDPKGRRHYGRLANFIELRSPSRVAFPESNVSVPQSANPHRMVSVTRERGIAVSAQRLIGVASADTPSKTCPATKKSKIFFDQELRDIYPKYGQVVEKPKTNLSEFLANQKARIKRKNRDIQESTGALFGRSRNGRESPMFGCKGIDDARVIDPAVDAKRRSLILSDRPSLEVLPSPKSSIKPSQKNKGVVPVGMYRFMPSPTEDKSPLHGITRPIELPDDETGAEADGETTQDIISYLEAEGRIPGESDHPCGLPQPAYARPDPERKPSDGVYSSIRNSNPFLEDTARFWKTPGHRASIEVLFPMSGYPSAIPKPLFNIPKRQDAHTQRDHDFIPESPSPVKASHDSKASRMPSYAGTGYDREIKPPFVENKLNSTLEHNAYEPSSRETSFALSGILEMVHPLERQDRIAGAHQYHTVAENPETIRMLEGRDSDDPQHVHWPGMTPGITPEPVPWPGHTPTVTSPAPTEGPHASRFQGLDSPPPVPPKHPARTASVRSSAGSDLPTPPSFPTLIGPHIISKENIRGHLSNISRDLSDETLRQVKQRDVTPRGTPRLTPFNKNMFPRRDAGGHLDGKSGEPESERGEV